MFRLLNELLWLHLHNFSIIKWQSFMTNKWYMLYWTVLWIMLLSFNEAVTWPPVKGLVVMQVDIMLWSNHLLRGDHNTHILVYAFASLCMYYGKQSLKYVYILAEQHKARDVNCRKLLWVYWRMQWSSVKQYWFTKSLWCQSRTNSFLIITKMVYRVNSLWEPWRLGIELGDSAKGLKY